MSVGKVIGQEASKGDLSLLGGSWQFVLPLCTGFLLIVYLPSLLLVYDYHDAYFHYRLDTPSCDTHPQWFWMLVIGRPAYDYINCFLQDSLLATPADGYKVRLIGIAILCLSAAYLCWLMIRRGINLPYSAVLASAVFALPGWLVWITFTCDVTNIVALPLIIAGFHLLAENHIRAELRLAAASTLLLAAMLIYQQLTPFFFVLIAIYVLLDDDTTRRWRLSVSGAISFGLAGLIYLAVHSLVLVPYVERATGRPAVLMFPQTMQEQAIKFAPLLAAKAVILDSPRVFALWFMNYADWVWRALLAAFALSSISLTFRSKSRDRLRTIEYVSWLLLLIVLVNALTLLAAEPDAKQRHIVPFESLIVAVIGLAAYRYAASRIAAAALLLAGLGYSSWNLLRNNAEPNAAELKYITESLSRYDTRTHPKPCIILSPFTDVGGYRTSDVSLGNEFGRTTTMSNDDIPFIIFAAARMAGVKPSLFADIDSLPPGSLKPATSNCGFIIDMKIFQNDFLAHHRSIYLGIR